MERFIAGRKLLDGLKWRGRAILPAALAALACAFIVSCSKGIEEFAPESIETAPAIATRKAVTSQEHGKKAMCPVTGRIFDIGGESESAVYKGRVLYFVDLKALEAFMADPSEYDTDPPAMPSAPAGAL